MRMTSLNLTTSLKKYYDADKNRGIFMCRNTDAAETIYVQFGMPSDLKDCFPVLAGDTLTFDRGDLSQEIFMAASAAMNNNQMAVG